MNRSVGKAKRYRERAEALRKIADGLDPGNVQRLILGIAVEYQRLARLLEEVGEDDDPASVLAAFQKPDDSD